MINKYISQDLKNLEEKNCSELADCFKKRNVRELACLGMRNSPENWGKLGN